MDVRVTPIGSNEQLGIVIKKGVEKVDQASPTEKSGPPRKVNPLFWKFSVWTKPILSVLEISGGFGWTDRAHRLLYARKEYLESYQLPPYQDTLREHCERANYQSAIWRSSPQIPLPVGSGWCLRYGKLTINWMSGKPSYKGVLELPSRQCKRACQLPSCTCLANGLHWTDICRLQECTNQPDKTIEELTADNSDVKCEDNWA